LIRENTKREKYKTQKLIRQGTKYFSLKVGIKKVAVSCYVGKTEGLISVVFML
jgi:hypothetical protein